MAEQVIKPDLDFVKGVIAAGGDSLKKCYQCATCSVVCNVTPDKNPFPRKEMIWAQWGLKEKFKGNPDVWLCHQCNDCTVYCPRGAKPGEVLGAIRKQTIAQYSSPGSMVNLVNNRKFMPFLFLIPAILLAVVISATGTFGIPEGEIVFTKFMPVVPIQIVFTLALLFGLGSGLMGMKKFWGDMKEANGVTTGDLKGSVIAMFKELAFHDKFKECDESKDRATSHLLVFYSFIALGIATGLGVLYIDILHLESPFRFGYGTPIKVFGTVGAVAIIAGTFLMMSNRFKNADRVGVGSYFDWLLIGIIGTIGVSGTLAWLTRVAGISGLAYPIYFIHLVVVLALFTYLPFSKLSHMFYRGAALSFNKYSGREAQAAAPPAVEAEAAASEAPSEAEQKEAETKQETGKE